MRLLFRIVFLYLLVVPPISPCSAQQPAMLHYTIDHGLPSNEVYHVYEDKEGYIWFATDHGVSRFDGYSFTNYSTSDGLTHNTIFGFYEDPHGKLWMRAFNSTLCYREKNRFRPYKFNKELQSFLGRDFVECFAFDSEGNLWFMSIKRNLGLYCQDAHTGSIKKIDLPSGYNCFIRELDNGEIIAGADLLHYVYTGKTNDTVTYHNHTWLFNVPIANITTSRGVVRCKRKGKNTYAFSIDTQAVIIDHGKIANRHNFKLTVHNCYVESDNSYWFCSNGFAQFENGHCKRRLLTQTTASSMHKDRNGNYWLTTIYNGVYMIPNLEVEVVDHIGETETNELRSLATYGDRIFSVNAKGRFFSFTTRAHSIDTTTSLVWPKQYVEVNTFHIDTALRLFLFTANAYNITPGFNQPTGNTSKGQAIYIAGIRKFSNWGDSVLIAGNQGWYVSNRKNRILYDSYNNGHFNRFCTAILGAGKNIWIGTSDGLYIYSGKSTTPYQPDNPVYRQRVTDIKKGFHGEIFVSTRGGGVLVIDGNRQYEIREKDGLCSDQSGNIFVDENQLWVCSNNGLSRVVIHRNSAHPTFEINRINKQHGLPSLMINDVMRKGDFIFMATAKGLAFFDVNRFTWSKRPPDVHVKKFLANNRVISSQNKKLTYNDRNIAIEFVAILFKNPGLVNYRYKLEGYERQWNYTTDRTARYFNLPAGDYHFIVSAMNENGIWNTKPASVRFYIPAHFTETTWFSVLLITTVAAIASLIVFFFVRQQRNRARTRLALALAELKALRAQMKPHFIFNSLNSIQNFILENDDESAHFYLTRFSSLMRKILDNTRYNAISLTREIETLKLYLDLEKLRFGKNFEYTISVADDVITDAIDLPPMLLQPYIENAIWHGLLLQQERPPRLLLKFTRENDALICLVEDNGIGRKKSMEKKNNPGHVSTGMKNIEERISILNELTGAQIHLDIIDLYENNGNAAGTRVVLSIGLSSPKRIRKL